VRAEFAAFAYNGWLSNHSRPSRKDIRQAPGWSDESRFERLRQK
jgi:hypothetical protein